MTTGRECKSEGPIVDRTRDLEIIADALQSLALPLSYRPSSLTLDDSVAVITIRKNATIPRLKRGWALGMREVTHCQGRSMNYILTRKEEVWVPNQDRIKLSTSSFRINFKYLSDTIIY